MWNEVTRPSWPRISCLSKGRIAALACLAAGVLAVSPVWSGQAEFDPLAPEYVVEVPQWRPGVVRRGADGKLFLDATKVKPEPKVEVKVPPKPVIEAPERIGRLVRHMAPRYGLDPDLVLAIVAVESNFNSGAVSPRNAQGLMQLIPKTARRFGVRNPFDPKENLRGGMRYLRWLLKHFKGDVTLVLAAYNAGEGAVGTYKGIPPYPETRNYVKKVRRLYPRKVHPYGAGQVGKDTATRDQSSRLSVDQ